MKIYFVRHGITQGNIEQRYNGIVDEPLCVKGREDLAAKKDTYTGIEFDYIYSSPLTRCKQSFEILFPDLEVDEYRDDLVEMDFGDWAGTRYDVKLKELMDAGYTWDDYVDPENGETYESLFNRTTNFLNELIDKHQEGETILVLCHGIVMAAIMKKHYLQDENMFYLSPENGMGYIVDVINDSVDKIE